MTEPLTKTWKVDGFLICVGCGAVVCKSNPAHILAISCRCGAQAPILYLKGSDPAEDRKILLEQRWATPASMIRAALSGKTPPHIEYYLGFSDHQSDLKTEVIRMLRAIGAISYTECADPKCRSSFERAKQRYQNGRNTGTSETEHG